MPISSTDPIAMLESLVQPGLLVVLGLLCLDHCLNQSLDIRSGSVVVVQVDSLHIRLVLPTLMELYVHLPARLSVHTPSRFSPIFQGFYVVHSIFLLCQQPILGSQADTECIHALNHRLALEDLVALV